MRTPALLAILTVALVFTPLPAPAADQPPLRLANILGDHMVLQRDKPTRIWGWAPPGAEVTVTITEDAKLAAPLLAKARQRPPLEIEEKRRVPAPPEGAYRATLEYVEHNATPFATVTRTVKADKDGAWETTFPAMPTSFRGKFILATSGEAVDAIRDVLVGVVWLNTGQSNIQRLGSIPSRASQARAGRTRVPSLRTGRSSAGHVTQVGPSSSS